MAASNHIPATKPCKQCGVAKPLTPEFFKPQRAGKFGFTSRCRECRNAQEAQRRARPEIRERQKAWRDANKDYIARYNRAYRETGYSSTAHVSAWRAQNLELARLSEARRMRERRARDPAFRLKCRIRARLYAMLQGKAGRRTEELLGYTMAELRDHIERQFVTGMSWAAVAMGDVEIDHIIPVAAFSITTVEDADFRVCWGLPNLRPMWALDNRKKSKKVLTLL